jgi:TRAP-type C4-dicarboxylate transport system permease small subunit
MLAMTVPLRLLVQALAAFNGAMTALARNLAAVLIAAMVSIVLAQIGIRAFAGQSIPWAEEATRIMLVWSGFLIAPYAHRSGANVAIDLFREALPARLQRALAFALHALVIWIAAMFLVQCLAFVQRGMTIDAATLPIKIGYAYLAAPIGFAGLVLVGLELVLREALQMFDPDRDWLLPPPAIVIEQE